MKRYKMLVRFSGLIISLLLLMNNVSFASKFMASDFGWHKVGQDSFLITLTIYKDCNGASLGTAKIYFKCASTNSIFDSLLISAPSGTEVTPVCSSTQTRCQSSSSTFPYGISRYIYQDIIYLNNAGSCCSIRMCYQDTNRTSSITTGAASQPFYTEAIFNRCISPNDHAPTFSNPPIEILCTGADRSHIQGINDPDTNSSGIHDSIIFEWATPLKGYFDTIPYTGYYSYKSPVFYWGFPNDALPFPRGIHLNTQTGEIEYRPMVKDVTVMAIKVKIFRNGNFISEVRRDILTIVIPCTNSRPDLYATSYARSWSVCAGDMFYRNFWTTDPDSNDTLTISYNNALPGAVWTDSNGMSNHPTGMLSWTPTDAHVSSLPYTFFVTATDNACPVNGTFTQAFQITVKPNPLANLIVTDSGCGNFRFTAQRILGSGPTYLWQGQSFNFTPNSGTVVSHKFKHGIYPYSMTMTAVGCETTYYDTIVADTFIWNTLTPDTAVCYGSSVTLTSNVVNNSGPVKMIWGSGKTVFNSDTTLTKTLTVTSDTIIWSKASDSTGCESFDTVQIKIRKPIGLSLGPDINICSYEMTQLKTSSKIESATVRNIVWTDLKTNMVVGHDSILVTSDSGLYLCILTDTFGCRDYDTIKLLKNPEVIASAIGQVICIGDETELQADSTGGGNALYFWYTGTQLVGSTRKIKVKPASTTDYLLKVQETIGGVTCSDSVKVRVRVNWLPVIKISAIDKRCVNGSIIDLNIYVTVNGIQTSIGIWRSSSNGLIYGNKFNPVTAGASTDPGWKLKYEYTDPSTGCYNKDSAYVTIFALPDKPVISLTPSNFQLECNLTNGSYKWFYRPDTTSSATNISGNSRQINPKTYCQSCYFSVVFTDSNGCISDTSDSYYFLGNSIENSTRNSGFIFYPNPAHSLLFIENPNLKTSSFILTNVLGNAILETNITPGKNELNLTNCKSGIYFIFLDEMIAGKIIIE